MATSTLGSNANNSLPLALKFLPGFGSGMATADVAAIALAIKDDQGNLRAAAGQAGAPFSEAFSYNGQLFVPNRGWLKILPGDWVAVDNRGWPILLSADTIASGLWTHNP